MPFDLNDAPVPFPYYRNRYQVSRTTWWRYRRAGLPSVTVGSKVFVRESDFITFLQRMDGKKSLPTQNDQCPQVDDLPTANTSGTPAHGVIDKDPTP